ncbi:triose-phosphate isomerase [Paraphotobacterium marinum]|uniref:Triosephosphate isomerase n=1 Tax=Paraphotobacterium marinum TaxID=1755811 RepID=A0A220VCL5_9GAMM|nr:triose-phosphate isomerase [Paraphotobacterium marinum]ASK78040.1 triose-phosphate isomerase [Paraphotobacterium marinum]
MQKNLVMGNWKLNGNKNEIHTFLNDLNLIIQGYDKCEVSVAFPVMYLDYASQILSELKSNIKLGAQNADTHNQGAYTGDISPKMLKELNVQLVIIGHSERREYHSESNELIAQKFKALQEIGLTPVLCIGESEEQNENGETLSILAKQLDAVINLNGINSMQKAVIAYEPIWAIGTGKAATANQAQEIHNAIRNHLASYSKEVAENVIIQYGGSVKPENAEEFFKMNDINGALVGGASLKAESFAGIVKS